LLMRLSKSRSTDSSSIELVGITLDLRPAVPTSLRAALVVRIQCGRVVDVLAHRFAELGHLVDRQIAEIVDHIVVQAAITLEDEVVQLATPSHTTVRTASSCSIDEAAVEPGCAGVDGETSASCGEESTLVLRWLGEVVPNVDLNDVNTSA
jgi:hypothetical protein